MEYEEEEINVPGNIPEFGAIFMSNIEMKKECFERRIFALSSSMANFVKQVKAGMVLFLFEFERRQLFGVYKATSDGALNILPHAFRCGGKQFPAQVCFTPIWLCSPLSENEFQSAIHENYYSSRKFKFGLSEDQVHRLLQLFKTRKLKDRLPVPPRQLSRGVSRFSRQSRRQIDHGRFALRDGVETEQSNEDFTPTVMNEYLEDLEDRGTEADDARFYMDDRVEDEENVNSYGQGFLTDHAGNSLHKKWRISCKGLETDITRASPLSLETDNLQIPMDKERVPAASGRFLGGENIDDGFNIFNSPAIATKYSERPSNLTKKADYERPYSDGPSRLAAFDGRFLMNDIMKTELGSHSDCRRLIVNEHDSCLFGRAGKTTDDCEFFMNGRLGHKHHIDNGSSPAVPSESFETSLRRVRGTAGPRKFLTNERVLSEHDPDSGLTISFSSGKIVNPLDAHQRKFEEQRFPRDDLVKAHYMEGLNGSATLNISSGYDTRIERQIADDSGFSKPSSVDNGHHVGTLPRSFVSTKSSAFHQPRQSSLECFNKPFPDIEFPGFTTESQNFKASSSIFHDAIVTRSVPCVSEVPSLYRERSISFGADQSTSLTQESVPHHSGWNFLTSSKGKSFEAEGSNRCNTPDFGNKIPFPNYHDHSNEICDGMHLKSPSSADYRTFQFSPFTLGSVPFTEHDLSTRKNSRPFDGHPYVVSQGMQKYIPRQIPDVQKNVARRTNDEISAGSELLSSYANATELDICHSKKDPINSQFFKGYRADIANDDMQCSRSPEGPHFDPYKHRRSVFTRLTSTLRLHAQEEQEEDAEFYDSSSVDEVMEILHQNQNFQTEKMKKFNSLARQHDEEDMERNDKKISFRNHIEHGNSKIMSVKIYKAADPAIEQSVDDKPKETRFVEFKRRRETKKSLDDNSQENRVIRKEDSVSGENKETKCPLDKQGKRRKLVRPVFGDNNLVDGSCSN